MSSVDIIVPCYQYGRYLAQCVGSVLSQTGPDVRVLIIDDASPDDTARIGRELATQDTRVTFVRHEGNRGHIATYNEGLDWASAAYVLLLSADDYLVSGALSRSVSLLNSHPEVGFVFGNAVVLTEDGVEKPTRVLDEVEARDEIRVLTGRQFLELCGGANVVPTPTALVRTALQKKVGGYRPELPHAGDMEMWWRLAAHASVGFVYACQAVYRMHAGNMFRKYMVSSRLPDLRQRQAVLDIFFGDVAAHLPWSAELRPRLYAALAREAVGGASAAFNEGEYVLCDELAELARRLSPDVRVSWPWLKLALKRCLGPRGSRILRLALAAQRGLRAPTGSRIDRVR